ncbi:MAG: FHA domain-containing protein [Anaerolineales bacterium]|nr:FHA domain-containing protein [Anaerolineales bacterium]
MAAQFQFVMRTGPTPGSAYPIEGDLATIGRDSSNSIVINDAEVSRRHARLTAQGGKYVLEDTGSTNGSFVNGQRIAGPHVLKPGDVLSFGEQISLVYEAINFDPAATIASPRSSAPASSKPAPPPPPPAQAYSGNIPAGPAALGDAGKKSNVLPIAIGIAALVLICACVGFLIWVDQTYRWCVFFPFLAGC